MSLKEGEAEQILVSAIDDWLKETDIKGTKVIDENLQKLNKANVLALSIFKNISNVEFECPNSGRSFTSTYIYCQGFDVENLQIPEKNILEELIRTVDDFSVNPINATTISIAYSIDNIWIE